MAERQRNFRQEILNCVRGELPGWDRIAAAKTDFEEVNAIAALRKRTRASEKPAFDMALKELLTDPTLVVDELGILLYYAITEEFDEAEPEILVLQERPIVTNNPPLREMIERYLEYLRLDREDSRSYLGE